MNIPSSFKDYIILMKPRVMFLVIFTSLCSLMLVLDSIPHFFMGFILIFGLSIGASAAAVLNNWYDIDIDILMDRTKNRPSAASRIHPDNILVFGVILAVFSILLLYIFIGLLASFLLLFTISYYLFIYTIWLKRRSMHNIVIGGVAGAMPPMISYVAFSNIISFESLLLFAIIFFWTPPHSFALIIFRSKDYKNAKIPMMPITKGSLYTKKQILFYTLPTIVSTILIFFFLVNNVFYLIISILMNLIFFYKVLLLYNSKTEESDIINSKKLFWFSIYYLFIIFLAIALFSIK